MVVTNPQSNFLTWQEAAEFLRVHKRTLARWYAEGVGPPRIKVGRQILYSRTSLLDWISENEKKPCRS
ncbi:MAG TPA: DNA-binding protein [Hyphomonas sp.]|nr:DNA-binding protein [Hyphomonas sp.]HBJ41054.1 DNA-binding protein [Hyphomonas sp.]HBT36914.1 DNA-binding protein [Hyphomonas sp.]